MEEITINRVDYAFFTQAERTRFSDVLEPLSTSQNPGCSIGAENWIDTFDYQNASRFDVDESFVCYLTLDQYEEFVDFLNSCAQALRSTEPEDLPEEDVPLTSPYLAWNSGAWSSISQGGTVLPPTNVLLNYYKDSFGEDLAPEPYDDVDESISWVDSSDQIDTSEVTKNAISSPDTSVSKTLLFSGLGVAGILGLAYLWKKSK